jgi:hypothetical protein
MPEGFTTFGLRLAPASTLELTAAALGENGGQPLRSPRGDRTVTSSQRLAAISVLAERETGLSAVPRLA